MMKTLRVWKEDFDGRRYTGTWRYRTEHIEVIVFPEGMTFYMSCSRLKMERVNLRTTMPEHAKLEALSMVRAFIVQLEREVGEPAKVKR
jgi:hypothetical protein